MIILFRAYVINDGIIGKQQCRVKPIWKCWYRNVLWR